MQETVKLRRVAGVLVLSLPKTIAEELKWEEGKRFVLTTSPDKSKLVVERER